MRPQGSPEELERRRRRGIELLKAGASVTEVARRLGCSHSSVILWREVVRRRGLKPIIRHRYRRDKVSAISAVTVSARRRRCGLYIHLYPGSNLTHIEVAVFLRALLRQLRGHVIVLWDGGSIHKGPDVRALLTRCPRLHVEPFPGYAPDLNPDEFVWTHFKATLANGRPDNLDELMAALGRITKKAQKRPE